MSANETPPWIDSTWLTTIPARIDRCVNRWRVTIGERLGQGNTSRVFSCVDVSGRNFVLKLAPAEMRPDLEAAALTAWDGHGSVRLIDFDAPVGALLMERISPATPLPALHDVPATELVAPQLIALHSAPFDSAGPFPTQLESLEVWVDWTRKSAESGTAGLRLLNAAHERARTLCLDSTPLVLLHGDFIDKNLLLDGERYVAVDPIPRIGDPCSDVGFYAAYHPPARGIAARARLLATRCGLDPERAARWAAIWAVGEATETWRADSEELQRWVQSAEATELLAS